MTHPDPAPPVVQAQVLEDLRSRLRTSRPVDLLWAADGWSLGVDADYLRDLLAAWEEDYDWRDVEGRIRSLPWVVAGRGQTALRAVHQRAAEPAAVAVVLLHGWPDSVMRFEKVLPLLADLHVVIPALPGYPFALPTTAPGMSAAEMATAVATVMAELGYEQYVVSAGDVGTDVAESLAAVHGDRVVALHLTDLSHHYALTDPPADLSAVERAYLDRVRQWHAVEGGYDHQQSTRPNTLAVGLATRRRAWPPGSWRSCTGGRTAVVTWRRCSRGWRCSTGSPHIGCTGRSGRRSRPTPIASCCLGRSPCRPRSPCSPLTSSALQPISRPVSSTSGHGSRRPVGATSMPGNARRTTSRASARRSHTAGSDQLVAKLVSAAHAGPLPAAACWSRKRSTNVRITTAMLNPLARQKSRNRS